MLFVIQLDAIFCRFEVHSSLLFALVMIEGLFCFLSFGQSPAKELCKSNHHQRSTYSRREVF